MFRLFYSITGWYGSQKSRFMAALKPKQMRFGVVADP
jgi:hypothetical protein